MVPGRASQPLEYATLPDPPTYMMSSRPWQLKEGRHEWQPFFIQENLFDIDLVFYLLQDLVADSFDVLQVID